LLVGSEIVVVLIRRGCPAALVGPADVMFDAVRFDAV